MSIVDYSRQKATVKRLLRRFGGGAACKVYVPAISEPDPDKPWITETGAPTVHSGIPCVFITTDFRFDTSVGYMPYTIVPEAREVCLLSAPDLPIELREGYSIEKADGTLVAVLRANLYAPDGLNRLLYIAQVTGGQPLTEGS